VRATPVSGFAVEDIICHPLTDFLFKDSVFWSDDRRVTEFLTQATVTILADAYWLKDDDYMPYAIRLGECFGTPNAG
jgi:hypothetical protein